MKLSVSAVRLTLLSIVLAAVAAIGGLLIQGGSGPMVFPTLRGQQAQIYGYGLYQNDTVFAAGSYKGTDALTLLVVLPLLIVILMRAQKGSIRSRLILLGPQAFLLYNSASMALGAAYNAFFLLYVAYFSASLFACITTMTWVYARLDVIQIQPGMPCRRIAAFLVFAGVSVAGIWISEILPSLLSGAPPALLGSYTTMFTHALDMSLITPSALLAAVLLLRRDPRGAPLAAMMLMLNLLVGLMVVAQTIVQGLLGVVLSPTQFAVFVGSFVALSLFAAWLSVELLRHVAEPAECATRSGATPQPVG